MLPEGFVYLETIDSSIIQDIRYASSNNFLGTPVQGYNAPLCITQLKIAQSLQKVQQKLIEKKMTLVIFDAYRPQRAVNQFVEWAKNPNDQKMKKEYYPAIDKSHIIELGYIATRSQHSRGCALDLSIAAQNADGGYVLLDMGTPFDFFDETSHTMNQNIPDISKKHRIFLLSLMEEAGFRNYSKEWWHFWYTDELYPETYFDFPIEPMENVEEEVALSASVAGI